MRRLLLPSLVCILLFAPAPSEAVDPAPRQGAIKAEAWLRASLQPATPEEIDRLIAQELKAAGVKPAPLTSDEQFLRRVMLDLTGELPMPADVQEFLADKDPKKRAKLIDQLLASDEFARH